jgi:hypothetical protein
MFAPTKSEFADSIRIHTVGVQRQHELGDMWERARKNNGDWRKVQEGEA